MDQGPELENYYSQDDFIVGSTKSSQDQVQDDVFKYPKRVDSSVESELSPTIRSAPPSEAPPFLSPPETIHEAILVHSTIKRRRTADDNTPAYFPHTERPPHTAYDPIRSQYRIYDPPKVFGSLSPDGFTYHMPEQKSLPKVVEAEYRRLADSAAAAIPPDSLLSPGIWKVDFYWPNQFTTTQCACLMRYYIENLAPWVSHLPLCQSRQADLCSLT